MRSEYFGDLYWLTTRELLSPESTATEAAFLARALDLRPGMRVLDCAAGHGRHARELSGRGLGPIVALDRSHDYLAHAEGGLRCRADMRALPFAAGAFHAAYSWYNSLFYFDEAANAAALRGLGSALAPGGRLVVHTTNPAWLAARPTSHEVVQLRAGGTVEEQSVYDPTTGRDHVRRRLSLPSGRVLEGAVTIRYYPPADLARLARTAGLEIERLCGGSDGAPLSKDSLEMIAVLRRMEDPHG